MTAAELHTGAVDGEGDQGSGVTYRAADSERDGGRESYIPGRRMVRGMAAGGKAEREAQTSAR